ncbi:MAG: hypothetical protein IJ598_06030 [Ruminococcus sp.]|nr:hypothetical protein [Ruminococcus sp.]
MLKLIILAIGAATVAATTTAVTNSTLTKKKSAMKKELLEPTQIVSTYEEPSTRKYKMDYMYV